uniref:Putative secreted protein n=1 Tax=Anopheles darlingi TaxID=43151 RepID=A0A2M4D3A6_ANODA
MMSMMSMMMMMMMPMTVSLERTTLTLYVSRDERYYRTGGSVRARALIQKGIRGSVVAWIRVDSSWCCC